MSKWKNFSSPHCHLQSLDTGSPVNEFVKRELELETGTITCTDHGYMGACRDVYKLAKDNSLTPILGAEIYHRDDSDPILLSHGYKQDEKGTFKDIYKYGHATMHALNQKGYEKLVKKMSIADLTAEQHGSERKPIFNWADLEDILSEDVTITAGCLIGVVGRHVKDARFDIAIEYYKKLRSLAKPGNFYVEIFTHKCDKNWVNGVFLTLEDGQELKFYLGKKVKTDKRDEISVADLSKLIKQGEKHKLLAIKNRHVWSELPVQLGVLSCKIVQDFVQNECTDWNPDGDVQKALNKFLIGMANRYGDKILCSDDAHVAQKSDMVIQEIRLSSLGENFKFYGSYHRYSSDEAFAHFQETLGMTEKEFEVILNNNEEWASRFKSFEFKNEVSLPTSFYPTDTLAHLYKLIEKHGRMDWNNKSMVNRLNSEIELLHKNGTVDLLPYFFLSEEVCDLHEKNGKLTGAGRGCLTGDTQVLTLNGYKRLDKMEVNDTVFSHTGDQRKVLECFKYPVQEKILSIFAEYGDGFTSLTKDHKVWAVISEETDIYKVSTPSTKKKVKRWKDPGKPSWVKAESLKFGDLIFTPWPKWKPILLDEYISLEPYAPEGSWVSDGYIQWNMPLKNHLCVKTISKAIGGSPVTLFKYKKGMQPKNIKGDERYSKLEKHLSGYGLSVDAWVKSKQTKIVRMVDKIKLDEDFFYLLGLWIGDGWVSKSGNMWGLAFFSPEERHRERVVNYLKSLGCDIQEIKAKGRDLVQVVCYNKCLQKLFESLFPDYKCSSATKSLGAFKNLTPNLLTALLRGVQDADGCVSNGVETIDTTSKILAMDIKEVLLKLHIPCSILTRKPFISHGYQCNESYKLKFKGLSLPVSKNNKIIDGHFSKILEIREVEATEVYDISVEKDCSYVTANATVHNSGSGMLIAYLLSITHVDPLKHKLSQDRFLTLDRIKTGKLPDIDQDLMNRDLLTATTEKYEIELDNGEIKSILASQKVKTSKGLMDAKKAFELGLDVEF